MLEPVRLSLIVNVLYSEVGVNVISELLASRLFNVLDLLKLHWLLNIDKLISFLTGESGFSRIAPVSFEFLLAVRFR